MKNKRYISRPIRRSEDITPISEMIETAIMFICVLGAVFLIIAYYTL